MVLFDWLIGEDYDDSPLHQVLLIVLLLQYHNSIRDPTSFIVQQSFSRSVRLGRSSTRALIHHHFCT